MKSAKNLLLPFIVFIALVLGVIIYLVIENAGKGDTDETSAGLINVVYVNPSDILSLSVHDRETGNNTQIDCSLLSNGNIHFEYNGDDKETGETYSQGLLSNYVDNMSYFACNKKISTASGLSEYGLDDPRFIICIKAANGDITTVQLGNKTPDGLYCYLNVEGSGDIYTITANKLDQADKRAVNFLESRVLNINYSDLSTVHFDRTTDGLSLDANVIITASGIANFEIFKPYKHDASAYFGKLIDTIVTLEISDYLEISDSDLPKYGLDTPAFHILLTMKNGDTTELFFSQKISGFYYCHMTGMDKYFMLSEFQIDGLELQENVLIDPYVCYCYAKDFTSITGKYGDSTFKLELNVSEGQSITAEDSTVQLDGRNAKIIDSDGRSYCSVLFESIACIKIGGSDVDAVPDTSKEPVFTLSFIDKTYKTTVYEFYTRDSDSYYVLKDGEYTHFYVYSRELFNNGGLDTYSYGCWSAYELLSEAITNSSNGVYTIPTE